MQRRVKWNKRIRRRRGEIFGVSRRETTYIRAEEESVDTGEVAGLVSKRTREARDYRDAKFRNEADELYKSDTAAMQEHGQADRIT